MKIISCPECGGKHTVSDDVKVGICQRCENDNKHVRVREKELQADPDNKIKQWRLKAAKRQSRRYNGA